MSQPTPSDLHVNRLLGNVSVAFQQSEGEFIAGQVFPDLPVQHQGDSYVTYDRTFWMRAEMQKRGPGTESAGAGYGTGTDSYFAHVWALHKNIDDQTRANADEIYDLEGSATRFLTTQYLLRKEKEFAANFMTTGIWTGSTTGSDITPGTLWSAANSTPISDVQAQMMAMRQKTGYMPNRLILGANVFAKLAGNADLMERIKYTQRGVVTTDLLASLLEFQGRPGPEGLRVLVALASENTAAEGAAAASYANVVDANDALLVYAAARPSLDSPSAGYTFSWTGLLGATKMGQRIKKFRMDPIASDRIEIEAAFAMKLVAPELGVYFNNVVS